MYLVLTLVGQAGYCRAVVERAYVLVFDVGVQESKDGGQAFLFDEPVSFVDMLSGQHLLELLEVHLLSCVYVLGWLGQI